MDEDCHSPLPSAILPAVLPQELRDFRWIPKGDLSRAPHSFSCPRPSVQLGGCQFAYREDQGENFREMPPILPGPTAFQPETSSRTAQSRPATSSTSFSVLCSRGQRITLCRGFRDSRAFLAPKEVVPVSKVSAVLRVAKSLPSHFLVAGRITHPCLKTLAVYPLVSSSALPHCPGSTRCHMPQAAEPLLLPALLRTFLPLFTEFAPAQP